MSSTARGKSRRSGICSRGRRADVNELFTALGEAGRMIAGLDSKLVEIVLLSLRVSLTAVALASVLGLPLGAAIAVGRFPGRKTMIVVLNALMGLPPVVVGLLVYLM